MQIAVTGATGFIGHYLVRQLAHQGHRLRLWVRPTSDRSGFDDLAAPIDANQIEWVEGALGQSGSAARLVAGCDAVIHAALDHPGGGFRGGEGNLLDFVQANVVGTIELIEGARAAGAARFVFISTCAVHEQILDDRPLDETHPLWPTSHYGAHKAALEKFVHSYGLGQGYAICALRPTGVYGVAHRAEQSKWSELVQSVVRGRDVHCTHGGKEVHAGDVARACGLLLHAEGIAGQAYSCYDRYISQYEVAMLAKEISGSSSQITGEATRPKHEIVTDKLQALGMQFGGAPLLRETVEQLVRLAQ